MFVIIGDLNEIGNASEKIGGSPSSLASFSRVAALKSNHNCLDIPVVGQLHTWRKRKLGHDNILKRLDMIMVSSYFIVMYPNVF